MGRAAAPARWTWRGAAVLWIALFAVYSLNGREIGSADTIPAQLQAVAIVRGDGFALDRFRHLWPATLPYYVALRRQVVVSRYPLGPAMLAVPFTVPQLILLDRVRPGWEADPAVALYWARRLGKTSAAAIGALAGVAIHATLTALQLGPVALPATLIVALGSNLWMSGSQSLWQHGSAALAIAGTLALLLPLPRQRWRLVLAGGACALLVHSRPHIVIFPLLVFGWVVVHYRARAAWFLILPVLLGALLLGYNFFYFGTVSGGYGELVQGIGPGTHSVTRAWTTDIGTGLLGTLFSPSRGLFVFSPWIPLSLALLPVTAPALRRWSLLRTVMWTLPVVFVQLLLQATWWAGWSFGPRYWTDVLPLFAVLLGLALAWTRTHSRPLFAALLGAGAVAIVVQAIGAFCYPSSFNALPGSIDHQHERLWSWSNGEIARCLREGAHRWGE